MVLLFLLITNTSSNSFALQMLSGDKIVITDKHVEDDDVLVSGDIVNIDAPVNSATVFANIVNAPIKGDLFIAAGQIAINSNVSGRL